MKKNIKAILCLMLSVVLCISVVPFVSAESEVKEYLEIDDFSAWADVKALTDGKTLKVEATVVNTGESDGFVTAYRALYNKDDMLQKATTEKIELKVGATEKVAYNEEYDSNKGEYVKFFLWDTKKQKPLCDTIESSTCRMGSFEMEKISINTKSVFASSEVESGNNATKVADGNLETYWVAKDVTAEKPQYVTAVLDKVYDLSKIGIAFGLGAERNYEFSVEASVDGEYYETVVERQMAENTNDVQYFETYIAQAAFVRYTLYGSGTPYSQITEIEAYGTPSLVEEGDVYSVSTEDWNIRAMTEYNQDYSPTLGTKLFGEHTLFDGEDAIRVFDEIGRDGRTNNMVTVKSITASQTPEDGNVAKNVLDTNTSTKWTAKGVSESTTATLLMEFNDNTYVDSLKIAFGAGERGYKFGAEVSTDGIDYETVIEKTTAAKDDKIHEYAFERKEAKYLRLTFYGRETEDENNWIQVTEARPYDSLMEIEGAGGVLMGKEYKGGEDFKNREKYNLSFDMHFKSETENGVKADYYWSGVTLANGMPTGGADSGKMAALQLRFVNENGKVKIKKLTSNRFNEGDIKDFFSTTFKMDTDVHFSLDVDPEARKIDITVSDGENTANRMLYYNYENDERTRPSSWSWHEARWLLFNSGASGKTDYYVKNITMTEMPQIKGEAKEMVLASTPVTEENVEFRLLADNQGDYEGSLGDKLYGEVVTAPSESGIKGKAIHIYDAVGRTTDAVNGAGAVAAYIDIPTPALNTNPYKVEFTMYAPDAGEYGGFSLGAGRNNIVGNGDNPLAMQARFRNREDTVKFAAYNNEKLNQGDLGDLVGAYTPIDKTAPWRISVIVDPRNYVINMSIDDGVNLQTDKTKSFCGASSVWVSGRKIDTLMINTGIGGNGDIYVGDIKVTDLGTVSYNKTSALNGVLRLMAQNGTGKYMHHNGDVTVDFKERQTMNYTRFVERGGLLGEGTVSFEVMNKPGHYLTIMPGEDNIIQIKPYENNARFKANASFRKEHAYGSNYIYSSYRDPSKYLYDNGGSAVVWSMHDYNRICFTLKGETSTVVGDDFKSGFRWDEWIPGYTFNQSWSGGNMISYHNHTGVARSSNIVVEDGICLLKATKDSGAHAGNKWGQDYANDYNFYNENGNKKGWESFKGYVGVITARRTTDSNANSDPYKFNRNSLIEGSFKQPEGARGYWTAFWLNGRDSWPPEIDIFEYLSQYGGGKYFSNIHRSTSQSSGTYKTVGDGSLQTKYHTYALDWGDGFIDFYFDGECYKRVTGDIANFQKNCELIINTGIGGWEYEPNNQTVWGTGLRIDWVRAYQW